MTSRVSAAELARAADPLLVALACANDDEAFGELVRRRQARVRKTLRHLCRDAALADDLAQQVFVTAWRSLHGLRSTSAFDGWLKRILVTTWLQELRRRRAAIDLDAGSPPEDEPARADTTAERLDLDAALARLAPAVRLCVVLAYDEGMTHPEIASATKLPLGTVKSHVARGAARLREMLHAYEEHDHATR
jgi:RNA polymerase sigma factor (sigma-70 family)